ncbi:MAG: acyltransferase family protein [Wenyingzhuangia sp.]|jgi:hypothetical protein|uniref:acyltransferase family protein n=1 Tax=Wenyingzhuangia sp. TaxID=1964193 RepID=UPI003219D6B6
MYLHSINYFRAIAIIFVISSHVFYLVDYDNSSFLPLFLYNTIVGSSTPFVFISGFLFHHVFYKKHNFKVFFVNKVKYVLFPYLIMSLAAILFSCYRMYGEGSSDFFAYVKTILFYYTTGSHIVAYWYVPFIMLLFLTSPLHVLFINALKLKQQIAVVLIFLMVSVFIHRPNSLYVFKSIQALFYYTPVYLIGILCSMNREDLYDKLNNRKFMLFALFGVVSCAQIFFNKNGNSFKLPFEFEGLDLMILQKICLSFFLFIFLHTLESSRISFLTHVAKYSFGMFFIHGYVLYAYGIALNKFLTPSFIQTHNFLIFVFSSVIVIVVSLLLVKFMVYLFKHRSRYIVGS